MKNEKYSVCKVLLFSDPHFSVDSQEHEEKWFPPLCNNMPKWLTKKFLSFWDNVTQHAFNEMLVSASAFGPFDLVIGCGDYTPGTNESGMITDEAVSQYQKFDKSFYKVLRHASKILVWGDHDTGYKFDVSGKAGVKIGTEAGGVTAESINKAKDLIGEPFGVLDIGFKKFVWISTNLIRNVDAGSDKYLRDLQRSQEKFVDNVLAESDENEVIFLLHDPTAINLNEGVGLSLKVHTKKIDMLLHGHLHARWNARLLRIVYKPYRNLCRQFPVHVIPASWGMMGIGKGFGVMDIFSDESVRIHWISC